MLMLVEAGANVNAYRQDSRARTALQYAVERRNTQATICLLDHGADPNLPNSVGLWSSPLQSAILTWNADLIEILLRHGADARELAVALGLRVALSMAIKAGSDVLFCRLIETLPETSEAISKPAEDGLLFQHALRIGGRKLADCLLKYTAPPPISLSDPADVAALEAAVEEGNIMFAALLIRCGVEVDCGGRSKPKRTPLQATCENGNCIMAQVLLEYGADVNASPSLLGGLTALQAACQGQHTFLVEQLIQYGADVDTPTYYRTRVTALEALATNGNNHIAGILLRAGANVAAPGSVQGWSTALNAAAVGGHITIVELLIADHARWKFDSLSTTIIEAIVSARRNGQQDVAGFLARAFGRTSRLDLYGIN